MSSIDSLRVGASNPADQPIALQLTVTITAVVHPEPDAGGYSAEVPALPGCYTQGETLDEVRANLREAVEGWLGSAHDGAIRRRADSGPAR